MFCEALGVNPTSVRAAIHMAGVFALYLSIAMLIPLAADLYDGNPDSRVFALSALFSGGLASGVALATYGNVPTSTTRFGFFAINLLWLTMAIVGSVPFFVSSSLKLSLAGAFFESVSAITTTGSTVITSLDTRPPGVLLWRSILQWMGGIGVIALGLFLLPFLKVGGVSYFKLESSDIEDKPFERFATFAVSLLSIYALLTVSCTIAYAAAGMSIFDALNHAMTTIATGGMSTHDASFGHYGENYIMLWIAIFFMFVAGIPFTIVILFAIRGRFDAIRDPQIRVYAAYCIVFAVAVAVYLKVNENFSFGDAITQSAFNFVSVITTTGYASGDYTLWGPFAVACFFVATFLGGCSGSTAGGIKAYRFLILYQMVVTGLRQLVYPKSVASVRYGDRVVGSDMQRASVLFISAFFIIWAMTTVMLAATGLDLITAMTGALTAMTNVGPGLGDTIGPSGNFSTLPDAAKWILSVAMLLGRLEILVVLVVFTPTFWSR